MTTPLSSSRAPAHPLRIPPREESAAPSDSGVAHPFKPIGAFKIVQRFLPEEPK